MLNLPWLDEPLDRVLAIHQQGRLAHANLIRASAGWGESTFANRLALNLLNRTDVDDARTLAHPDIKWLQPDGSVIKVDEIRRLAEFAVGTRQSAPCKVAVIESAELMNDNAANALLKTLEEPPQDTYLLLTTCRPSRLLPTIVSRCQVLTLGRDPDLAKEWLLSLWSKDDIDEKLFECGGAPLTVSRALDAAEPPLGPLLGSLAERSPVSRQITALLDWDVERLTSGWYRHCLALLSGQGRIPSLQPVDRRRFDGFVDELKFVRYQLLMTNSANQRLLYERLAARWKTVVQTC